MATTLADIHSDIIQTHILPRLDGPSLSAAATSSSQLQSLCSDDNLWSHVSKSTWPSITDPRVDDVISTFPAGHHSFFQDSFPSLITDFNHRNCHPSLSTNQKPDLDFNNDNSSHLRPSELISAVDLRYENDIIYSNVEFTEITTEFISSSLQIQFNNSSTSASKLIDLEVNEFAGVDEETLSHLKKSMTLNWILIDPTLKRAVNLSSIKPVSAKPVYMTNETLLQYVTVLPGCNPNEMVECKIEVVLGFCTEDQVSLHVKSVVLKLQDLDSCSLNGRDFLVITHGAMLEENNVRRKVVDDADRCKSPKEFKEMKREKKEWVKKEERKREFAVKMNYVGILVSFCSSMYFLSLLLQ